MIADTEKHSNRPHCLYLWYTHGVAVCSEQKSNRECPYAFWKCPVKSRQEKEVTGMVPAATTVEHSKVSVNPEMV